MRDLETKKKPPAKPAPVRKKHMPTQWVMIDESNGAHCQNGEGLSTKAMELMAAAMTIQMNRDYSAEYGGAFAIRAGTKADIKPGEQVYSWLATLPNAPGAIAYHDVTGAAVRYAVGAITLTNSLFGPDGASVAASHEMLEDKGDPGCNVWVSDGHGKMHAREMCDGCETQYYMIDGVAVSDFFLEAWWIPGAAGPYTYCSSRKLFGDAPGPLKSIPAGGGNYQLVETDAGNVSQVTAMQGPHIMPRLRRPNGHVVEVEGAPRRPEKVASWTSRVSRRVAFASVTGQP